jgi:hypothetical protein
MRLVRVVVIAVSIVVAATAAWAQKPDFSGTWTLESVSTPAAGGSVSRGVVSGTLGSGSATVTQTAEALIVERTTGDGQATLTYRLDGTDSRNVTMSGGRAADSVSTVTWNGPKLTIVTREELGGQLIQFTEVWTVEGSTLTVERTTGRETQKSVYKK